MLAQFIEIQLDKQRGGENCKIISYKNYLEVNPLTMFKKIGDKLLQDGPAVRLMSKHKIASEKNG